MPKPPDTLIRVLAAGGGLRLDAGVYPPDVLVRFAAAASSGGATLILQNADSKVPDDFVRVAAAGRGRVIFEF
jgi:hypothetical protein